MLDFPQIKLGSVVQFNNTPCVIIKCEFLRMQQRKPVKKCIMKNLVTGTNVDYSFKSGEGVEEADLKRLPASFMYRTGDVLNFMLLDTFETIELPVSILDSKADYLKEGLEISILYFNDKAISVDLPIKITYTIGQTSPVMKGNTVSDVMKDATLENGKIIKVPAFIKEGEKILVNTVEDEYVGRDTEK